MLHVFVVKASNEVYNAQMPLDSTSGILLKAFSALVPGKYLRSLVRFELPRLSCLEPRQTQPSGLRRESYIPLPEYLRNGRKRRPRPLAI